jgi:hypothetical protein
MTFTGEVTPNLGNMSQVELHDSAAGSGSVSTSTDSRLLRKLCHAPRVAKNKVPEFLPTARLPELPLLQSKIWCGVRYAKGRGRSGPP